MHDRLQLGIPDDEAATAPARRFVRTEARANLGRALVPFAIAAVVAAWNKLAAGEIMQKQKQRDEEPYRPSGEISAGSEAGAGAEIPGPVPARASAAAAGAEPSNAIRFDHLETWEPTTTPGQVDLMAANSSPRVAAFDPDRPVDPEIPSKAPGRHDVAAGTESAAGQKSWSGDPRAAIGPKVTMPPAGGVPGSPPAGNPRPGNPGKDSANHPDAFPTGRDNDAPLVSGPVQLGRSRMNDSVLILASMLLAGATDPDADTLCVEDLTVEGGTLSARPDGSWLFTPEQGFLGEIAFSFRISDGTDRVAQTATLLIHPPEGLSVKGSADDDMLIGTPFDDAIAGDEGEDILHGRQGHDVLSGGEGDDRIVGGAGNDVIRGDSGDDRIFAGAGDDIVFGGAGDDVIDGGDGDDLLFGGPGDDRLQGGAGNDVLVGGAGADLLDGGAGDDRIVLAANGAGDEVHGGGGTDTLDFSAAEAPLTVDLLAGTFAIAGGSVSTVEGVENVKGGPGNDTLVADAVSNVLSGGGGDDVFVFESATALLNDGGRPDRIDDFETGDRIDFSGIDLALKVLSGGHLHFLGFGASSILGAVTYQFEDHGSDKERTIVKGRFKFDDDGHDENGYFALDIDGLHELSASDFIFDGTAPLAC